MTFGIGSNDILHILAIYVRKDLSHIQRTNARFCTGSVDIVSKVSSFKAVDSLPDL